jgi:hypothetical protein
MCHEIERVNRLSYEKGRGRIKGGGRYESTHHNSSLITNHTNKDLTLISHSHWHIHYQIMTEPSLTTLIGEGIQGKDYQKLPAFVDGGDGFFYGIPYNARRVVKFNPLDKSLTEIGPDLGDDEWKWKCGVLANTGSIYCAPYWAEHILKIDTIQGTVETLDNVELPETGGYLWSSGALAADNHIYYMPDGARRIMRLNSENDTLSSVGDDLGQGWKYRGTVVGNDDHVFGIPNQATRIIKFDPSNPDTTSTVGEETEEWFDCGNGVLAGDGYIYAANHSGQVLKIDTTISDYTWIVDPAINSGIGQGWDDPIIGADKCIYWPPFSANRVLKFDPGTQQLPSLVGDDLGTGRCKWKGGALATTDGAIYCIPFGAKRILTIDPFKEFVMTLQNNIYNYPEELGRLFAKDGRNETFYGSAVRKFGMEKVFKFLVEECLPSDKEWADTFTAGNLPLFMVAASCDNSAVSVIYHLLRRNVHDALSGNDVGVSTKKRKLGSA